ncbi:MAG: hypothetical protein GY711_05865 [bacterium]|nr:hypothetical protein [bacterium]
MGNLGPDCWGELESLGYNLIGDTTDCTVIGDETGNLDDLDPGFVSVPTSDFRLLLTSPAVEAGDAGLPPQPGFDVDGDPRWLDADFDGAMVLDLGALEFDHVQLEVRGIPTPG